MICRRVLIHLLRSSDRSSPSAHRLPSCHRNSLSTSHEATTLRLPKIPRLPAVAPSPYRPTSGGAEMEVVNTPSPELALTNCAFVSAADLRRLLDSIALVGEALVLTIRYPYSISLVHLSYLWLWLVGAFVG